MANQGFEKRTVPLDQGVLVIGGGIAGITTAAQLRDCGYRVTLVEVSDAIGGQLATTDRARADLEQSLQGVELHTGCRLDELEGNVGSFVATIRNSAGPRTVKCGAIVVASGNAAGDGKSLFDQEKVLSIAELLEILPRYPVKDQRRPVGLVLDMNLEEGKASTEMVLRIAIDVQKAYGCDVFVFCRDIRVSSLRLEMLYDEARDAGVNFVKYDGTLGLEPVENGVVVAAHDVLLGENVEICCNVAGISPYGVNASAEQRLAATTGVDRDMMGQMQANNVHLFPGATNRPGVFVVGACRGRFFVPQIITEAKATALAVHQLLSQKSLVVELSQAVVDEDKCALCLTCIRSCPHKAMTVNEEKKAAEAVPEVCQRCGICAGECPAKAIVLPQYTDEDVLKQIA